ncbi:hypothetical protein Patl1_15732 [Pistacia atlantica]|uniref:Uncharacterized protein n=1 Tax=Pistacia atlantica TaxID=434234 RepID=A0ACC1B9U3_9ROSI|nr:hypothetical protein Patl1_15732 [Pistacia atlantica]
MDFVVVEAFQTFLILTRQDFQGKLPTLSSPFLLDISDLHCSVLYTACRTLLNEQYPGFYLWFLPLFLPDFAKYLSKRQGKQVSKTHI